jgi:acyl-CoA synthetase (AMP-forming)/AMP-acid ligase II
MGRGGGAAHSQAAGRDGARRGEEHEAAAGAGDGGGASAPPRPRLAEAAATGPADGAPGGAPAPRRGRLDAWRLLQDAAAAHGGTLAVVDAHGGSGGAGSGGGVSGGAGAAGAGARVLTYAQLARRAAALAAALGAAGAAGRGSRLAVLMRNRAEVLEAHFAAAALHAVVVNVNTALAPEELAFVLADSGATTVLASDEFAPALTAALRLGAASRSAGGLPAPLAVRAVMWAPETGRAPPPPPPGAGALPWPAPPADDAGAAGVPADAGAAVLEFELEAGASEEDGYHMYYTRWVGRGWVMGWLGGGRRARAAAWPQAGGGRAPRPHALLRVLRRKSLPQPRRQRPSPCASALPRLLPSPSAPCSGTTGRPKGVLLSHRIVVLHALATVLGARRGGTLGAGAP